MRLLLVLGPSSGGIGRHVRLLADGFPHEDVTVAGPGTLADGAMAGMGERFVPLDIPGRWGALGRVMRPLARLVRDADVVHAHGLRAGIVSALVARRARRPLVVTLHNLVRPETGGRAWRLYRPAERVLGRLATIPLGVSPEIARRLGPRGRTFLVSIEAPVPGRPREPVRAALGVGDDDVLALCPARLHPQKGLDTLLAAANMPEWDERLVVLVAGDGPLRAELEAAVARAAVRVRFLGQRRDLPDLYGAADLVVLPSRWEGVPLVAHEAAWTGLPIVATDVGGTGLVVVDGETGFLVPSGIPSALAAAVAKLAADPSLRRVMGKAAAAREEARFSVASMLADVKGIYEEARGVKP